MSGVTFKAVQLRGVPKVATLTWMGHGLGLRRAQLLTVNPKPFHIYTYKPYTTRPPTPQGGAGANPKTQTQHPPPHHRDTTARGEGC